VFQNLNISVLIQKLIFCVMSFLVSKKLPFRWVVQINLLVFVIFIDITSYDLD